MTNSGESQNANESDNTAALAATSVATESGETAPVAVLGGPNSHFFQVRLDLFDGPIDLLLHLVKQNELAIETISLAQVTNQYLECLEAMRHFDLEIAGEYLVIAATLVSIKSSILLDQPVELVEDEEGRLVDPHEQLLQKLREAAIYREGAVSIGSRPMLGIDVFSPPSLLEQVEAPPVKYRQHDAMLLGKAFQKLIEKAKQRDPSFVISIEHISIVERMRTVLELLEKSNGNKIAFEAFVPNPENRHSIVASFIALLELCKRQVIVVQQDINTEEIVVGLASEQEQRDSLLAGMQSEFDTQDEQPEAEVAKDTKAINQ